MRSFVNVMPEGVIYLKPLTGLVEGELRLFVDDATKTDRISQDGIITALGHVSGQNVGIIYQDFRVNGASVSKQNAQRMMAFMELLREMKLPLIFLMNSLGVRITQGRTIFNDAFSVIPTLFTLKNEVPVITAAIGNTIGINAIYFAQGHIRLSVNTSALNLAGPEVHRRFFGDKNLSFNNFANASHQIRVNTLVHETMETVPALFDRIKSMVSMMGDATAKTKTLPETYNAPLKSLLGELAEEVLEFFPRRGQDVKIMIGKIAEYKVGLIINPPERPNNLLTVPSIDKIVSALELFKTMSLPVISVIDCPGGDPRQGESDADGMMKMTELVRVMINYPFPKMGIIHGRCFGGSGMFAFPAIFGGQRVLAVQGSQLGIMNDSIIKELLANSPRLYQEWQIAHETETADLKDMIKSGVVNKIITRDEIREEVKNHIITQKLEEAKTQIPEDSEQEKLSKLQA
jgi:acetyl-CoA carboxylase carboxyltransferase component